MSDDLVEEVARALKSVHHLDDYTMKTEARAAINVFLTRLREPDKKIKRILKDGLCSVEVIRAIADHLEDRK